MAIDSRVDLKSIIERDYHMKNLNRQFSHDKRSTICQYLKAYLTDERVWAIIKTTHKVTERLEMPPYDEASMVLFNYCFENLDDDWFAKG